MFVALGSLLGLWVTPVLLYLSDELADVASSCLFVTGLFLFLSHAQILPHCSVLHAD